MNCKGPWEGYRQQAKSRPLSPSRLPSRAHFHRERETSGYEAATRLRVWFLPLSPLWNRVLKSPFVWGICYSILTLEQGRFSNPWLFPIKLRWNNTPVNRCMNRIPNILIILVKDRAANSSHFDARNYRYEQRYKYSKHKQTAIKNYK